MNPLACASGVDLIIDYLEGVMAPELRLAVEAHVASCPRCVAFLESYRATPEILRRATAAAMPAELSETLLATLRARLDHPLGS